MKMMAPQRSRVRDEASHAKIKPFLDTSVALKQLAGHSEHKAHFSNSIPQPAYVSKYVRMEFYRTLLMSWVDLYFEASHPFHRTFGDALAFCSDKFGRKTKAYLTAIANILGRDGLSAESSADKSVCLRKLEDTIFEVAYEFERAFIEIGVDPTGCARARSPLRLSRTRDRFSTLSEFEEAFSDTGNCRARCAIKKFFQTGKYAGQLLAVAQIAEEDKAHPALKNMREPIRDGNENPAKVSCFKCGKIGDAIIAISMPAGWKLHSLDTVHEPICQVLGKEFQVHPSVAHLKKQAADEV